MNYATMRKYDTSNWSGVNSSIFLSGCNRRCTGCFNEAALDFNYGFELTPKEENLFIKWANDTYVVGVCILGGEPFQQDLNELYRLLFRLVVEVEKPIHVWTGYTFEELYDNPDTRELLPLIDTLVDSPFIDSLKDLSLLYRGSSNQRVIDVRETMKCFDSTRKLHTLL